MKIKWFDLLRTGKFKTLKGEDVEITEQDLSDIETNYNPDEFSAPMTLGHPKDQKEPAYGWIATVKKFGNKLCFAPGQVVKEFAEAVNKGMFPKVSAGIENADNGTKALNHVAFLGAWKPAVSGLAKIEGLDFASQKDALCIEFADWNKEKLEFAIADYDLSYKFETIGELLSGIRDFIIDKYDTQTADTVLASWQIDQVKKKLIENSSTDNFAEKQTRETQNLASLQGNDNDDNVEKLKNEIKEFALKTQNLASLLKTETELKNKALFKVSEMESKAKEAITARARFEFSSWANSMVEQNKLYPNKVDDTVNRLMFFASNKITEFSTDFSTDEIVEYKSKIENNESTDLTTEVARKGKGEKGVASAIELAAYANKHITEMATQGTTVGVAQAVEFVQNNLEKFQK